MTQKGGVTRKAQQSCREQPETPSAAPLMPRGELIQNDNKEELEWDKSWQKCSGREDTWPSSRSRWSNKQQTWSTGHLSVTFCQVKQGGRAQETGFTSRPHFNTMAQAERVDCKQAHTAESAEAAIKTYTRSQCAADSLTTPNDL